MPDDALTLIVEFEIRSDEVAREEWLDVWGRRAVDAYITEPDTLAYGAAVPEEHSDQLLIFERYRDGEASLHRHMHQAAHSELIDEMTARRMTRRQVSLAWLGELPDWGRWGPVDATESAEGNELRVIGLSFPEPTAAERFIASSSVAATDLIASDDGPKMVGATTVLRPDPRRPELQRGDLVVVSLDSGQDSIGALLEAAGGESPQVCVDRRYRPVDAGYFWK